MGNLHIRKSKHIGNYIILDKEYQTITFLDEETGKRRHLSPIAEAFFARLMGRKPGSFFHVNDFVNIYDMSPNTVCKYLDELQKAGLLHKQPIKNEKGQFYQHYFLQECPNEEDLKEEYEKEEYSSGVTVSSIRNGINKQINTISAIKNPNNTNLKNCEWKPVSKFNSGNQSQNLIVETSLKNCDPCIINNINNINNNINNNLNNINAFSSLEEKAIARQESQSLNSNELYTLENKHNNLITGDGDQVGSIPKKIKNKLQQHELEKEKNGGNVSVDQMIMSKVSDLSYTDNELAKMKRQMNVISAEQKENKTKQNKRERQFTLVKEYIDKTITDPDLNDKWKQYALTLKEKGSLASKTQFIEIYNNATKDITDKTTMLECLSNSISHGWVGVYLSNDKKDKQEKPVQQYVVPTPMKDRKIARDANGNPLLF